MIGIKLSRHGKTKGFGPNKKPNPLAGNLNGGITLSIEGGTERFIYPDELIALFQNQEDILRRIMPKLKELQQARTVAPVGMSGSEDLL